MPELGFDEAERAKVGFIDGGQRAGIGWEAGREAGRRDCSQHRMPQSSGKQFRLKIR